MQLLMPILEILMSGLLIPHPKSNANKIQRPSPWLSFPEGILDATHATALSRILQTFCRPSVSSVARPSARLSSLLTDETRKVRKYTAKYIPYILMHYCGLLLVGKFSQEVRKALVPGIWACIEIVPHEKLQAMHASMGRDEREVWRSIWAEFQRTHR
jgi:nucleolar pre-ribosomal-associated protein 2